MKKIVLLIFSLGLNIINAQNCNTPSAYTELNINNIKAGLLNGGDMWWDGDSVARYEYPNNGSATPKNVAYTGAIWLTGYDSNNDLKCSAQLYRTNGFDFWTGPILNYGPWVDDSVCSKFDRFFEVYKTEVGTHLYNINTQNLPLSLSSMNTNIKEWPGKGNQYLLSTYGMHIDEDLAPFNDTNNNGFYDPENGDYPLSKGDQCIFWVINDIGNVHTNSGGDALGVEIQIMAYAYATNNVVNDATFYDYTIIKKTPGIIYDFLFSNAIDADIGDANDDFIGCDTVLDYGFTCNGTDFDSVYGQSPPVFVTHNIKTPNNVGMSSFIYFLNGFGPQGIPQTATHYRNYQTSRSKNNSPLNITHAYPDNPASGLGWSECISGNPVGDRKTVQTSGPYTLKPNYPLQFTLAAIVIPTDSNYTNCIDKTTLIDPVVTFIDNYIDTVNNKAIPLSIINFLDEEHFVNIYPNPATDKIYINIDANLDLTQIEVFDINGSKINATLKNNSVDLKDFSKGIYTLKLYNKKRDSVLVKKFIVQ